jgi:hypothetical protein
MGKLGLRELGFIGINCLAEFLFIGFDCLFKFFVLEVI